MSPPVGNAMNALNAPRPKVSPFSATEIGHNTGGSLNAGRQFMRQHFRDEAVQVSQYLTGIHHARKLGHMQVNYADTVDKMSALQSMKPTATAHVPQTDHPAVGGGGGGGGHGGSSKPQSKNTQADQLQYTQLVSQMNAQVAAEQSLNHRKRLHNREVGRKALLHDVMRGTAPIPRVELYPQGVTHTQMLAMTGTLAMPSASIIPPQQPPRKRWLGEGEGWGPTPR